jgi:hypothetical protein
MSDKFNAGSDSRSNWFEGDFNYDHSFDALDLADFLSTGLFNSGSYIVDVAMFAAAHADAPTLKNIPRVGSPTDLVFASWAAENEMSSTKKKRVVTGFG